MTFTISDILSSIYTNPLEYPYVMLLLSAVCGGALGTERKLTGHVETGGRTLSLVSLGSCLFTILPMMATGLDDPWRMGAQVVTGIGFIGAGVLIKENFTIKGLTTAATIWVSSAIGVCYGAGQIKLAFFTTIFAIVILLTNQFKKSGREDI